MMLVEGTTSDAMGRVTAFLTWEDLRAVTFCCRAARDPDKSAFFRAWVAQSTLVLPPHSLASHAILSTVPYIDAVIVPHSKWLDVALADEELAPRLARVRRVKIHRERFQVKPRKPLDLAVIAHAFPSTTHLTIERLEFIEDVQMLRCFRYLRRLEASSVENSLDFPISASDFTTLEELKLMRINLRKVESLSSLSNLRSLEVREMWGCEDLSFLRQLPKLTDLRLVDTILGERHLPHLLAVAPQLTRFECREIFSLWSDSVDGVDANRLALAFDKLETLVINFGDLKDLTSFSLIGTLRNLRLGYVKAVDLSPLQRLGKLERLYLDNCVDLSTLPSLPRLQSLTISDFDQDHVKVPDHSSLRQLQVFDGRHEVLTHMSNFDSLQRLSVRSINGKTILSLGHIVAPRLRQLSLELSDDTNVNCLSLPFPNLRKLSLKGKMLPRLADLIAPVNLLESLESLRIDGCPQALEIEQLALFPKLRRLNLTGCIAKTLSGIEKFRLLRELHLPYPWRRRGLDLSPLEKLQYLQVVKLPESAVGDVTPLTRIPSLRSVELPHDANCEPLVIAYHAARMKLPGASPSLGLQEVISARTTMRGGKLRCEKRNCLWGKLYSSKRVKFQLRAMANTGRRNQDATGRIW